ITRPVLWVATRLGRFCAGGVTSHSMSPVPACSCCCTLSEVRPSVTVTLSTYACRSGSDDCAQAGLRASVKDLPAVYDVISYGPSDRVCCRKVALSGTYFMYSIGRAEQKPMVRMYRKSGVELSRWNVSVVGLVATTPASGCEVS